MAKWCVDERDKELAYITALFSVIVGARRGKIQNDGGDFKRLLAMLL